MSREKLPKIILFEEIFGHTNEKFCLIEEICGVSKKDVCNSKKKLVLLRKYFFVKNETKLIWMKDFFLSKRYNIAPTTQTLLAYRP